MSTFFSHPSKFLIGSLVILPPFVLSLVIALPYYEASKQEIVPYHANYAELAFPTWETQKIPMRRHLLALNSSNNAKKEVERPLPDKTGFGTVKRVPAQTNSNITPAKKEKDFNINNLDLSGLSPELAARFESAMNDPADVNQEKELVWDNDESTIELVKNGAEFMGRLPALNFQTHNYTSKLSQRWVKVNGKEVSAGENITPSVSLLEINPRNVIIEFENKKIEVPALYEWKG
ncbi:general secretion pathway protein GspB [Aliivibrio sp. SR45-2]|uniref:general secretion pathway protein GspB n=1 Tax=Aliivibrio sp. SR45-2 TaxID=2760931 RepID=UPI0015FC3090|nr:general secretion pathway protein GspB [Aliivibrio sp. SR45-2]MBB1312226.1 general secretion pathway protein GspB [Aliivibrio sp. SR45-2]